MNRVPDSELNYLIAPEIKDDDFYQAIQQLARNAEIKTVLEIGSSSGQGSTEAFVKGLKENPNAPQLFCMEISKPRFEALKSCYADDAFVHCYNMSSVGLDAFPQPSQIEEFYHLKQTPLNQYPVDQVVGWLHQDIEYVKSAAVPLNGIQHIKQDNHIDSFDLVLIDGSEFTGETELEQVYGAKYLLLDDICTYKNFANHHRLLRDPNYELIDQNTALRNGYSIFRCVESYPIKRSPNLFPNPLPIHFFTIVLNGEPFIRYHLEVFKQLPFSWHWHIVEGVAELKHDTAWSVASGGQVVDKFHRQGRSKDGTTDYLDELAHTNSDYVSVYRKPEGEFWDGKREMVNAPLSEIKEPCLLWQIDVDELWTVDQLCTMHQMFIDRPDKTAAYFWCNYFVGDRLMISSRHCYSQNPKQEWLRVWRYEPGMKWAAHEPPLLVKFLPDGTQQNIASMRPFLHSETQNAGLIFQHFAYVTEEQLQFKESYYAYHNAVDRWKVLQSQVSFPLYLRDYFPWVKDDTLVERVETCGVVPLMEHNVKEDNWTFLSSEDMLQRKQTVEKPYPQIIVDGVFFQFGNSGIAQVWRSLLENWAGTDFAEHLIVLDRNGTAPRIPGIRYRPVQAYTFSHTATDAQMLQEICEEKGAHLFISSYYTTPITTPSVSMTYDMIPEVIGSDLTKAGWKEKHLGIMYASRYITISENTAKDLCKFFPHISPENVTVAHCGIKSVFSPACFDEIQRFKDKFNIQKPYFLTVGERVGVNGYKNAIVFFRALSKLLDKDEFEVICVGGHAELETELAALSEGISITLASLNDDELKAVYTGAIALVYPTLYEGFGLPVGEAMACGCPVITCRNSSIPEVAGEAAIYIDPGSVFQMIDALYKVQHPEVRQSLVEAGFEHIKQFSWERMSKIVSQVLLDTADTLKHQTRDAEMSVWQEFRNLQKNIQTTNGNFIERIQKLKKRVLNKDATIKRLQEQLENTQSQLEATRSELESTHSQVEEVRSMITEMEKSKFWRLRNLWFKVRRKLGLSEKT